MILSDMLEREAKNVLENEDVANRKDCTDLLISAKFGNDHLHHILPRNKKAKDDIIEDLVSYKESSSITKGQKVPDKILFRNRQAIGDILTFTAGVRDFCKQFPSVKVGVHSTAGHIWDNNPYIDHSFKPGTLEANESIVDVGPGFLTNRSGTWDYHMCNAFRLDMQNKLNVKIEQGPIRPDIWMTEEEYNRKPIIDGPYWLFFPLGAKGWPSKQFHRWQEVIDILKDNIQFVQMGSGNQEYHFDNVIDFVGKTNDRNTGIRDLFNLFLHAQGTMGLVSMHMHLSAAFNNPSIVVAGGREPASFTQYYGHQYIHNNGSLPCVEQRACWACKLEGCRNLVTPEKINKGHISEKVPKCVDIIEPEQIAYGVKSYYKGGRLEYGKKIPNTFFKNIVKEKKIFSVPQPEKVSNDVLKKYGMEFGGGALTDRDWEFMCDVIKTYNVKNVLEFGAGLSTLLLGTKVNKVVTFETQQGWIDKIRNLADENKNHIFQWDGKSIDIDVNAFKDRKFDMAFIDGPAGGQSREFSTMYGSKLSDVVIVHDAGREWERKWQDKYLKNEFNGPVKGGHRSHLWVRKDLDKKKKDEEQKELKVKIENDNRPSLKMLTTCRGFGGSERSSLFIMKDAIKKGYRTELVATGNISGEYRRNIPEEVIIRPWEDVTEYCDILVFYTSDCIFSFNKPQYTNVMDKLNCGKKVMILNYKIGGAGQAEWTKNWDNYMFLNSTNENELLKRIPNAKTKVLPPPTSLNDFFKVNIDYENGLRLIRHSSQRDAKWPENTNEFIKKIWSNVSEDIKFYFMPARSDCINDERINKFRVNQVTVPQFLSQGNCFLYHLPNGYTDAGPRVILEAAACGLPIISDNHSGPKDRVIDDIGWLCDTEDDYFDILLDINKDLTILEKKGKMAKKYAMENFIPEKWMEYIIGE